MKYFAPARRVGMWTSLALICGLAIVPTITQAQTASGPQFLVTWSSAGSYIPSFYTGKALPTYGSKVTASVELISNGKLVNLSGQTIYWYLNDTLIGGGAGTQTETFSPLGDAPNYNDLEIELPDYPSGYLIHTVQVPMTQPEAVILAPYPNETFSQNPLTLSALPYFFNTADASNLSYTWSVNNQQGTGAENPEQAQISIPAGTQSGTALGVSLSIENPSDSTVGMASENLTYETQL